MDNVLPKESTAEILRGLADLNRDLSIFAEIRATTPLSELKLMRTAGMHRVQIGIEALSTRLLRKLHKGTTAIQNLEIMKHCEALGIANLSNLISFIFRAATKTTSPRPCTPCSSPALSGRPSRSASGWASEARPGAMPRPMG